MEPASHAKVAKEIYDALTPGERRKAFILSPRYRSAYNRILDSEDRMTLPRYFWRKWLPVLGADAATLYVVLRDMSQVEAKGADSWCWPEQSELGRRIGVSKKPLRRALGVLEEHGFIKSERRRERLPGSWQVVQSTNDYQVFLDIPLTPEDSVEVLLSEMARHAAPSEFCCDTQTGTALSSESTLRGSDVHSAPQRGEQNQTVRSSEVRSAPLNVMNEINVSNVGNGQGRGSLKDHPVVKAMSPAERRRRSALAFELGEALSRMAGGGHGGQHKSLGLHRRLTHLMPEQLIREALRATSDAVAEQRAGRKTLTGGPSAYFAGIAFSLAKREGINLGIKRRSTGSRASVERSGHGPMEPGMLTHRATRQQLSHLSNPLPSDDERARVRGLLRGLIKSWESEGTS